MQKVSACDEYVLLKMQNVCYDEWHGPVHTLQKLCDSSTYIITPVLSIWFQTPIHCAIFIPANSSDRCWCHQMILKMMLKLCIIKEQGTKHCQCLYDFHDVKHYKFALTNIFLCFINSITLHTATFFGFGDSKSKIIPIHIMKAYGGVGV